MATTVARLQAVLSADTRDFDKAMGKSDSRMKGLATTAGKAGLAGAVIGLGAAVKVGFDEFMQGQKVAAQTAAVIKSTGGAANVTAAQVDKLSESLMKKSGVDDEEIKTGQNMLLTFKNIRNETGAGAKVFDQATKATLDLSVAMGKDMQSSAIMVGKALNDPIKGLTAMNRVGIQFSEAQEEQIKHLVRGTKAYEALSKVTNTDLAPSQVRLALEMQHAGASVSDIAKKLDVEMTPAQVKAAEAMMKGGQMAEAQKVILKELETQFGGSAEAAGKTFAGQIDIAKQRLTNFSGDMVEKAIPYLQTMFTTIAENLPKLRNFAAVFVEKVRPAVSGVYNFLNDNLVPVLKDLWTTARDTWQGIARVLKENEKDIDSILGGVKTLLSGLGTTMKWLAQEITIPILKPLFTEVLPVALNYTIDALRLVVAAVTGVKNGFVWLRDKGGAAITAFRNAAEKPLKVLQDAFGKIVSAVQSIRDGIEWLIEKIPDIPSLPDIPFFGKGDPRDPNMTHPAPGGVNLMGASPVMAPFAAAAAAFGLQVTSGLRSGAITANGTPSDHGIGKALDVAGPASAMAAYFKALVGNRSVKQAFYDPLGSLFGGAWSSYREGGHSDHVHVATYDKGGVLRPGWTMAYNGTGRNEYVSKGQPILVSLVLDGKEFARALFDPLKNENTRRGRLGGGLTA